MARRLKVALTESFVGAIALGWLLAQGMMHFANIFTAPIASWVSRKEYAGYADRVHISTDFSFRYAWPELARSASLLLICYLLLRWLYYSPAKRNVPGSDVVA